ncbi:MAG: MtrB/PioB family decaheme-associated outer membrane protein [Gammaproteobacteria bacterium]|nr:MtrB/PioB family decaheme-associated outer membrane protein [Gammaproteobacteria bacterium]
MNGQFSGIRSRNVLLAAAVAAILSPIQVATAAEVDTSEWKCTQCPFQEGGEASVRLGYGDVSEDAAKFADYTGLDGGGYVIADVAGRTRTESGWYLDYEGRKLGLDSRDGVMTIGKEGVFKASLSYDAITKRTYDDTMSPFTLSQATGDRLSLPTGWVRGSTTAGMTQLASTLKPVDIGHDREKAGLSLDWRLSKSFGLFAKFSREDKEGNRVGTAGNFTTALQMPEPIDSATDSYEFGFNWTGKAAHARLSYYVQKFDNQVNGVTWDNPFTTFTATTGRMATSPDNESKQLVLSAGVRLALDTSLGFKAVMGSVSQDAALLPYTITAGLSPGALPRASLNGDLSVNHYALTMSSRPFDKIRVRGAVRFDERKDDTPSITFANGYVESDLGLMAGSITPERYSYKRRQGELEGEYEVLDGIKLFVGMRGEELKRTNQDVDKTTEGTGYSGLRILPAAGVSLTMRIGETHRDAADARTPESWENANFWKYNQANRDRDFLDVKLAWTPAESVTVSLDGSAANDAYTLSPYGLKEGNDRRVAANIAWMPKEGLTVYADGGYQVMEATQTNQSGTPLSTWTAEHKDVYKTLGLGAKWTNIGDKWDVSIDYARAESTGEIDTMAGTASSFPDNTTDFRSLRIGVAYRVNEALRVGLGYRQEKLESADWALQGLQPATVATLLALGADPYNYDVDVISLSFRYDFGGPKSEKGE